MTFISLSEVKKHEIHIFKSLYEIYFIYILSVVAIDESNIPSCLHFSMQNIEMYCDLNLV